MSGDWTVAEAGDRQNIGPILVVGATGYVGSRLVQMLLNQGFTVRAASRSLDKLSDRAWSKDPKVQLRELDVQNLDSCKRAVAGCDFAYYLVHSMNPQNSDFEESDRRSAGNMVQAGEEFGLKQIIYLGGLGENDSHLSKHLRSRAEVATILRQAKFPSTVLRAAMIIGSGSASFEILRYLVERLPIMITPRWVSTPSQPIAIRNVLIYLIGCLNNRDAFSQVFDIGGPEVLTYRQLMEIYAAEAGLARPVIVPVPVFTPRISSYWINFITPIPAYLARPLAEGLKNPAVCKESSIRTIVPQHLLSCKEAIDLAIDRIQHHQVESHWTDAGKMPPAEWFSSSDPNWSGGTVFSDIRQITIEGTPADAWRAISRIGGTTGWYYANWLWKLRGFFDEVVGGAGMRRGRRDPSQIRTGDAIDFWRVRAVQPEKRLLLIAEMRLPGQAALEFQIVPLSSGRTRIIQIARFLPLGLPGLAYWYAVTPFHAFIFSGMLNGVARASRCKVNGRPEQLQLKDIIPGAI